MTVKMISAQVLMEFVRNEPAESETLENVAEGCLAALNRDAKFLAYGPVVSVNFARSAVELECTVCVVSEDEIESKMDRIAEIARAGIAAAEYETSTSASQIAVPA